MHFPNAKKGVKNIFAAEIIQIVSAIVMAVGLLLCFTGVVGAIIGVILMVLAFVADIVAFIMNLVGLHVAGNDDKSFKTGLIFAIIGIVVAIVGGILAFILGGITNEIVEAVGTAIEVIILCYVCEGLTNLFGQIKGQEELAVRAKKLQTIIIVLFCVSVIFNILGGLLYIALPALGIIFVICYVVAKVASYITYLVLLSEGGKVL